MYFYFSPDDLVTQMVRNEDGKGVTFTKPQEFSPYEDRFVPAFTKAGIVPSRFAQTKIVFILTLTKRAFLKF